MIKNANRTEIERPTEKENVATFVSDMLCFFPMFDNIDPILYINKSMT